MTSNTSNSKSEQFGVNTSQRSESSGDRREALGGTENDEDESFRPELDDDELSSEVRSTSDGKGSGMNLQV